MRLIDADALIEAIKPVIEVEWNKRTAPVSWSDVYEDFITELEDAATVVTDIYVGNKWISVKDRLPDDNQTVVTYSSTGEAEVLTYDNHYIKDTFVKYDGAIRVFNVTHWMPLPEAPKGE